jgi:hypothetical protein
LNAELAKPVTELFLRLAGEPSDIDVPWRARAKTFTYNQTAWKEMYIYLTYQKLIILLESYQPTLEQVWEIGGWERKHLYPPVAPLWPRPALLKRAHDKLQGLLLKKRNDRSDQKGSVQLARVIASILSDSLTL